MTGSDQQAEDWDFGRKVHGYAWRATEPRANLILQHGLGEHAGRYVDHYSELVPHLIGLGFNVFAFDAEGHGRSPGPRGHTDLHRTVEDHLAAREAVAGGGLPLFLFGHSLGGLITAASVAQRQSGVDGVVLSAPALELDVSPALRIVAKVVSKVAPTARLTPPLEGGAISRVPEEVEAHEADPLVFRKSPTARLGASAMTVLDKAWRRFPDWQVPVLVLHGAADRLVPVEGSRRFIETVAADDSTLSLYQGGYHELLNDLDRKKALEEVLDWLSARLAREPA